MDYVFHWGPVWRALPQLLQGAVVTLEVAVLSMAIGLALAIPLAIGRIEERGLLYRVATVWVEVARNTPALFQLYMAYFGLGAFGLHLSSYTAVVAALSFNNAGYLTEILRGGFKAVPATQMSAGRSLGMGRAQTYGHIIVPQVLRSVYFPITNQMIWSILMSSLGMIVGLKELSGVTQFEQSKTFRTFEFFVAAAVIYYLIAKIVMGGARVLGWRLFRG